MAVKRHEEEASTPSRWEKAESKRDFGNSRSRKAEDGLERWGAGGARAARGNRKPVEAALFLARDGCALGSKAITNSRSLGRKAYEQQLAVGQVCRGDCQEAGSSQRR